MVPLVDRAGSVCWLVIFRCLFAGSGTLNSSESIAAVIGMTTFLRPPIVCFCPLAAGGGGIILTLLSEAESSWSLPNCGSLLCGGRMPLAPVVLKSMTVSSGPIDGVLGVSPTAWSGGTRESMFESRDTALRNPDRSEKSVLLFIHCSREGVSAGNACSDDWEIRGCSTADLF